jgi:uncharacterized protein with von Willebrand factor type A (vWA) domain
MHFRYEHWDPELKRLLRSLRDLLRLFNELLLRTGGDAEEALRYLRHLQQQGYIPRDVDLATFQEKLEASDYLRREGGRVALAPRGERTIRRDALNQIFSNLKKGPFGEHRTPQAGEGGEPLPELRPYRFGDDPMRIDFLASTRNAVARRGLDEIRYAEDDLEVHETEHTASCATVLMLDVSHSMVLYGEDRITPAKKVALALAELITTEYPKDSLDVLVFGDDAQVIPLKELPYVQVGPYHTNTQAGLRLAQRLLRRKKHANRQIFMITDGKPSAIFEGGRLYKNPIGLDPKIVNQTLREAASCRRIGVPITTFMVADDPWLVDFVEKLTKVNHGRAYFSSLDRLGGYLFVDYIKNRRRSMR